MFPVLKEAFSLSWVFLPRLLSPFESFWIVRGTRELRQRKNKQPFLSMIPAPAQIASECDLFNSQLASFYWPFRRGGNVRNSTEGQCYSFTLASRMRSIFNMFRMYYYVNQISARSKSDFDPMCEQLADVSYEHAYYTHKRGSNNKTNCSTPSFTVFIWTRRN